jgi:hypothetical protein
LDPQGLSAEQATLQCSGKESGKESFDRSETGFIIGMVALGVILFSVASFGVRRSYRKRWNLLQQQQQRTVVPTGQPMMMRPAQGGVQPMMMMQPQGGVQPMMMMQPQGGVQPMMMMQPQGGVQPMMMMQPQGGAMMALHSQRTAKGSL